jgi:ATP-binding protein involved in chromosome partitioning
MRSEDFNKEKERLRERMSKIKHKIVVLSGKGGVGKSTFSANLSIAFAVKGYEGKVGVLDADIHGYSIPKLFNITSERLYQADEGIIPVEGPLGIKVASAGFLVQDEDSPIIWRGPLKAQLIRQFLSDIIWGELEYLIIDLPPGTGDEPLSIAQELPDPDGAIIVTIPSELSERVVRRSVNFAKALNLPVIGIVENMSGFVCPHCGTRVDILGSGAGEKIAKDLKVPFLGKIPLDPRISESGDKGVPFILEDKNSEIAKIFLDITDKIENFVRGR